MTASASESTWVKVSHGAMDAKQTIAVPSPASGRNASASRAVPTRSTVRMRLQSAMVGEMPAAWVTARRAPSSEARAAQASQALGVSDIEYKGLD